VYNGREAGQEPLDLPHSPAPRKKNNKNK